MLSILWGKQTLLTFLYCIILVRFGCKNPIYYASDKLQKCNVLAFLTFVKCITTINLIFFGMFYMILRFDKVFNGVFKVALYKKGLTLVTCKSLFQKEITYIQHEHYSVAITLVWLTLLWQRLHLRNNTLSLCLL